MSIGYCCNCIERCEDLHGPCYSEEIGCTEDFRPDDVPRDGESTSARLRRVEQERDEAREAAEQWCQRYADMADERDEVRRQGDVIRTELVVTTAELVSAKTELGHLRRERDQLRADLTEALDEVHTLTNSESAALAHAELERDRAIAELNEMVARKNRMQGDLDAQLGEAREQLANATVEIKRLRKDGAP